MCEILVIIALLPLFIMIYLMVIVRLLDMIDTFFGTELIHKISKLLRGNSK